MPPITTCRFRRRIMSTRIGRTGRAAGQDRPFLPPWRRRARGDLPSRRSRKLITTTIPRVEVPGLDLATLEAGDGRRRGRGGRRGGRSSAPPERGRGPRREAREPREPRAEQPAAPVQAAPACRADAAPAGEAPKPRQEPPCGPSAAASVPARASWRAARPEHRSGAPAASSATNTAPSAARNVITSATTETRPRDWAITYRHFSPRR